MKTLEALGWTWRTDGVEVCAQLDGQRYRAFVPLARVWHEFAKALSENGTPLPAAVGGAMTVAGLFDGLAYAAASNSGPSVGWFGSKIFHAVSKAASAVTHAALAPVATVLKPVASVVRAGTHALNSVPVFGHALAAATTALTSPVTVANQLVQGGKISGVAMNALKENIASVRTLAPYAQTVVSVVPGVGQGISGALGAGLALANGMSITQAVEQGVKDALPGGPLARAAFDVAIAAAQGKSISQVALAALPIADAQKHLLVQGVALARDMAAGRNVSHAVMDAALTALPADAAKAVQIATALSHAKNLQQAVGGAAQAAGVSAALANGMGAAQQILARGPHLPVPASLVRAVQQGLAAKQIVSRATNAAAQGHQASSQFLAFLQKPKISGPLSNERPFTARYHTAHHAKPRATTHHRPKVGAPALVSFAPRYHTTPATVAGFHGEFAFKAQPVAQLYPARMPYQTPARLHYAYGR